MPGKQQAILAGRAAVAVEAPRGEFDKSLKGMEQAFLAFGKRLESIVANMGQRIQSVGQSIAAAGAVMAAPLVASSKGFAEFEKAMSRVQALTGANKTQFAALSTEARRLGESTIYSATQAAEAMQHFALAGYDVDTILKAAGPTLNLAAAGQLSMAEAAEISTKVMAGAGVGVENMTYAIDVMAKAMTTANTDLRQLGDAIKYAGPVAKIAGVSFEEMVAAIQVLSNAGIQADMAGTTLRGTILALADPSKEATEWMRELGISVKDARGNMRPLSDIIGQFEGKLAGLGSADKVNVIGKIFDARQAAGVAELVYQGADAIRFYEGQLRKSGETAQKIADVQLNNIPGAFERLASAISEAAIVVGESLEPAIRAVLDVATRAVGKLAVWIKENREMIVVGALASAAITGIGVSLIGVGVALKALGAVVGLAVAAFAALGSAIAMLVSPLGLVAAGLVSLGVVVGQQTGFIGEALDSLAAGFEKMLGRVRSVMAGLRAAVAMGDINRAVNIGWLALKSMWASGVSFLQEAWANLVEFVQVAWVDAWAILRATAEIGVYRVAGAFQKLGWFIQDTFRGIGEKVTAIWDGVWDAVALGYIQAAEFSGLLTPDEALETKRQWAHEVLQKKADAESRRNGSSALQQERQTALEIGRKDHESALADIYGAMTSSRDSIRAVAEAAVKAARESARAAGDELDFAVGQAIYNAGEFREEESGGASRPKPKPVADPLQTGEILKTIGETIRGVDSAFGAANPRSSFAQERAGFDATGTIERILDQQLTKLGEIARNTKSIGVMT